MNKLIQEIHDSKTKAMIIEIGCGTPISTLLFSVAGASNSVYAVESPYSREAFDKAYGKIDFRAVSSERLQEIFEFHKVTDNDNFNTVVATTFQVGDETNKVSTHGWIAIKTTESVRYYHISIHNSMTRKEYISTVGEIGIKLLHSNNETIPSDCYVDIVLDNNRNTDYKTTLEFLANNTDTEQMSVFKADNTIDRLESVTRNNDTLVLFKGSFNPVSKAHLEVMDECEKLYPNSKKIFSISIDTFQKGVQEVDSLIKRIELINELGFDIIMYNKPLFKNSLDFLRQKYKGKVIYPMGMDTINRLVMDYIYEGKLHTNEMICDFNNAQLICLNRNGNEKNNLLLKDNVEIIKYVENFYHEISSTDIRKHIENGDFEKVKEIVPNELHDIIKNKWMKNESN